VIGFIARRLASGAVSFLVLTLATFVLFFQIPADPARFVRNRNPSEAQLAQAREKLGVDEPVLVQYGRFLRRLAQLDFGESFASRPIDVAPVRETVVDAAGVSASLVLGGAVLVSSSRYHSASSARSGPTRHPDIATCGGPADWSHHLLLPWLRSPSSSQRSTRA
jgi:ABC-type dipeptide/oligopeptide/nickel transport system permease component